MVQTNDTYKPVIIIIEFLFQFDYLPTDFCITQPKKNYLPNFISKGNGGLQAEDRSKNQSIFPIEIRTLQFINVQNKLLSFNNFRNRFIAAFKSFHSYKYINQVTRCVRFTFKSRVCLM